MPGKRTDYINWEEYFMGIALLSAERSKDPVTQVGACIVNKNNKIVGVGYNSMPFSSSDDELPWTKDKENKINSKHSYVCHAELNAIVNKYSADLEGCTIYQTRFPCCECAKLIAQTGIKKVIFLNKKLTKKIEEENNCVMRLFDSTNPKIECVKYEGKVLKTSFKRPNEDTV